MYLAPKESSCCIDHMADLLRAAASFSCQVPLRAGGILHILDYFEYKMGRSGKKRQRGKEEMTEEEKQQMKKIKLKAKQDKAKILAEMLC